jgi:hypothetical protein
VADDIRGLVLSLTSPEAPGAFLDEMLQSALASGKPTEAVNTLGYQISVWLDQIDRFDQLSLYAKGLMLYHLDQHWEDYAIRDTFEDVSFDVWATYKFGTNWRMWIGVTKKWVLNMGHVQWVENIPLEERLEVSPSKVHRINRNRLAEGLEERQLDALFDENIGDHQFRAILNTTEEDDKEFLENGGISYEYSVEEGIFYVWSGDYRTPILKCLGGDPAGLDFINLILEKCNVPRV